MKNIITLFISAILIAGCAGSSDLEYASLNQEPCRSETEIDNPQSFVSETAENFIVYQQGDNVYLSMDVRTYCNSKITFEDPKLDGERIMIRMRNAGPTEDNCVCFKNVTTSIKNIEEGTYNFMILGKSGNQLLVQKTFTVEYK